MNLIRPYEQSSNNSQAPDKEDPDDDLQIENRSCAEISDYSSIYYLPSDDNFKSNE